MFPCPLGALFNCLYLTSSPSPLFWSLKQARFLTTPRPIIVMRGSADILLLLLSRLDMLVSNIYQIYNGTCSVVCSRIPDWGKSGNKCQPVWCFAKLHNLSIVCKPRSFLSSLPCRSTRRITLYLIIYVIMLVIKW